MACFLSGFYFLVHRFLCFGFVPIGFCSSLLYGFAFFFLALDFYLFFILFVYGSRLPCCGFVPGLRWYGWFLLQSFLCVFCWVLHIFFYLCRCVRTASDGYN